MTHRLKAMHYQVEVLYGTLCRPLCNHPIASNMTEDEAFVTCVNCKRLLGHYDVK